MAKGNISKQIKASFFDSALRFSFVPGERKEPPSSFALRGLGGPAGHGMPQIHT